MCPLPQGAGIGIKIGAVVALGAALTVLVNLAQPVIDNTVNSFPSVEAAILNSVGEDEEYDDEEYYEDEEDSSPLDSIF